MGLDLFLYRVEKPTFSDRTRYFIVEDVDNNPLYYSNVIKNNSEIVTRNEVFYNKEQINKDYNVSFGGIIENEDYIDIYCTDDVPDRFRLSQEEWEDDDDFYKQVLRISKEDIAKYTYLKDVTYYVCDLIEVVYQRKGINNYGWSIMPENLSYTSDFDKVQALCEEGGLDKKFVDRWVEGKTVFRPWW